MTNKTHKSDLELQVDVLAELEYAPNVKTTDIGVVVKDGTVTLTGYATSFGEKWDAVNAIKRVAGVKAIADEIKVELPDSIKLTDGDIATAAANQINTSTTIPSGAVRVTVRDGVVTLDGEVEWWHQKKTAENLVKHLAGIKEVVNMIFIRPKLTSIVVESAIKSAMERNALLDAGNIHVEISGNKVTLRGKVRNYAEIDEAERVAWAAPGVLLVDNLITCIRLD
jgi:osmotically-inducible protein OsmY